METNVLGKPERDFTAADTALAGAMLVCGFLYWNLIHLYMLGAGVTIFAVLLFAFAYIYLAKSGIRQNAESLVCLVLAGLSAAQFILFDNQPISSLNFMFISVLFVYWICLSTGRRIDKGLSIYIIGDAVNQGLSLPFRNFGCCAASLKNYGKNRKAKGIAAAIIGIVILLPLLAVVIRLLMSADGAFESFIGGFLDSISVSEILSYVWQFVIGIPVAFYLYGLLYGNVKGRYADKITAASVDRVAEIVRIAPKITIYSALTCFNAIYLLFFAVQAAYLFSAFGGNLPEVFTYAEYARRGFFELCTVAGINLSVLAVAHLLVKRAGGEEPKALRVETVIISLFTILLIATALSKMAMYINAYGLTQMRVFTSWFMILLLFVFALIGVRQFIRFNSAKVIIMGFVLMFMILLYGNIDGQIAKYNIARYEAGSLPSLDIDALGGLSDAAAPYIYGLYLRVGENDADLCQQLAQVIRAGEWNAFSMFEIWEFDFKDFNLQRYRADKIRALLRETE